MSDAYIDLTRNISTELGKLRTEIPETLQAFNALGKAASAAGALDKKTKELIAVALSVGARCDPCVGFHTQALVKLGATRAELAEVLAMAVYMGGGPSLMYAAKTSAAFDEYTAAAAAAAAAPASA